MGLLDGILGNLAGAAGGAAASGIDIGSIAGQLGLSEDQVRAATAALGQAHAAPGDTISTASAATGLSTENLQAIVAQLGGENALAQIANLVDRDGDGNPLDDLAGFAGKLFGR